MEFLFILHYLLFFLYPLNDVTKEGDQGVAHSTYYVCHETATCTCDIISNVPAVNTINRHGIFACTLLHL